MPSKSPSKIDGYAVQNTMHVLMALKAYELKAASGGDAVQAAIDYYAALSQKRVTGRTVRRWLAAVKSYGGIEKTPENAFGARRACSHVHRPVRQQLRGIQKMAKDLLCRKSLEGGDHPYVPDLVVIERRLNDCAILVENNASRSLVSSIAQIARRLEKTSVHRLYRFVLPSELDLAVAKISEQLRNVLARSHRSV